MALHTVLFWIARQSSESSSIRDSGMNSNEDGNWKLDRQSLSSITGMLSILCWFIVLLPQLWTNYKRKSGESVSLPFLFIWLLGDTLNLVGAAWNNLLLTMKLTALYYIFTDFLLIGQVYYYRKLNQAKLGDHNTSRHLLDDEESALLGKDNTQKNTCYSGASTQHILPSSSQPNTSSPAPSFYSSGRRVSTVSERARALQKRRRIRQALMVLLPVITAAFFIISISGKYRGSPVDPTPGSGDESAGMIETLSKGKGDKDKEQDDAHNQALLGVVLGWGSAILYLGSRIPQIYKNWKAQSCDGLSVLMFVFSVLGNILYVSSIFLHSTEREYLIINMPWWLGSGGTLFFDFMIFGQFYLYRNNVPSSNSD